MISTPGTCVIASRTSSRLSSSPAFSTEMEAPVCDSGTVVPVAVNDRIVIPRGSDVNGTIVAVKDKKGKGDLYALDWLEEEEHDIAITETAGHPGCIVGTVEVYDLRKYPDTDTGADFEILLRNPQRMEPVPFKFMSRGRIAKINGPSSLPPRSGRAPTGKPDA